jgi:hypothetical protein
MVGKRLTIMRIDKVSYFEEWLNESAKSLPTLGIIQELFRDGKFTKLDNVATSTENGPNGVKVTVTLEKGKAGEFFCRVADSVYGVYDWSEEPYAEEQDAIEFFQKIVREPVQEGEAYDVTARVPGVSLAAESWEELTDEEKEELADTLEIDPEICTPFMKMDPRSKLALIHHFKKKGHRVNEEEQVPSGIDKTMLNKYRKYSTMDEIRLKQEIDRMALLKKAKSATFDADAYRVAYYYLSSKATEVPGATATGTAQ